MRLTVNEKRKRAVMSLEMSLKAAVDSESDDSVMHRIAQKNGFNINTFRSSLNPTTPTHKANIYHLEAVLAETRDPRIMAQDRMDHDAFAKPRVPVIGTIMDAWRRARRPAASGGARRSRS